ncbi:MAG: ATP-binding cassette domain-containing protein [Acidobacteria bacterium]|nr:ATP-binding cassette domain-containing protein [Thermoanaerobaculia bacterium]MDI9630294.1 ATP-binding cassette domain-containing protein [Acidobacteriota bacterium]MBP7812196.1 ATP-binding cassette domain-containing protein [Thermoanaerobaculia bacterium]MBP8844645.1 ATP-binding cassette domain-containing protein [Thermoanaerobaculia bacterium]NLN11341.1 ATP-binding cassette domain-containing protein [Acidobacteriota bacterium]
MAEPRPLVAMEGVGFRYGADVALADVDLVVAAGERLAILGPNGGGKSTLVRLLLGLLRPSEGEIRWPLTGRRPASGYVPQFSLFDRGFPLRVEEMVLQGRLGRRRSWKAPTAEDRELVAAALARLDLVPLRGAYLTELSGGELKRALVARALVAEPDLLVLDEPTASLDEASRRRLWELVAALPATTTVLLVTHDLAPETFRAGRAVLVDRRVESLALGELHRLPLLCGHRHG